MVSPPLGPVLYLIFSRRNDRHLGNVDKESGVLPVKSKIASRNRLAAQKTGWFAFYLQCVKHFCARLQCGWPLPRYCLVPEGLHSFGNIQWLFSWWASIFILLYQDARKRDFTVGSPLTFQGHLRRDLKKILAYFWLIKSLNGKIK